MGPNTLRTGWVPYQGTPDQLHPPQLAQSDKAELPPPVHYPYHQGVQGQRGSRNSMIKSSNRFDDDLVIQADQ